MIKTEKFNGTKTILFNQEPMTALSIILANDGLEADADGKKILKAGTPLYGNLTNRGLAFVKATQTAAVAKASFVYTVTHACSASGNISVQLGYRAAVSVAVTNGDSIGDVAAAISAATFPGWTVAMAGQADKLKFTAVDPGEQPAPVFGFAATGVTGTADAMVQPSAASNNAVGILLHDVDVTAGNQNTQMLVSGIVNLAKLGTAELAMITAQVKSALAGRILFVV